MKRVSLIFILFFLTTVIFSQREISPGNREYFVAPISGNDDNSGNNSDSAWKSFYHINNLKLSAGDKISIIESGDLTQTLNIIGKGTKKNPITINFSKARYDIYSKNLFREKYQISNTNDDPNGMKAVALLFKNSSNIKIEGNGAILFMRGKMIETVILNSKNISISNLNYDYHRPTVSEFKVLDIKGSSATIEINKDSAYEIRKRKLYWIGEGWELKAGGHFQQLMLPQEKVHRCGNAIAGLISVKQIRPNILKLKFFGKPKLQKGFIYQNRDTFRDYSAFFISRSKNIYFKNVNLHFLHGMGIVSQFSENLTFDTVNIEPRKESGRTCSSWADMLHFSNCKGQITIKNTLFSGANDDAINIHGTHLKVISSKGNTLQVKYMHNQTYGFTPFIEGDKTTFISRTTLLPYGENRVRKSTKINNKIWELELEKSISSLKIGDVIENVTWSADVEISNCTVKRIPTRGFLLSTRGKIVVKDNLFFQTYLTGILVADDGKSWYESGAVTNLEIKNNIFDGCMQPIITIHPENSATENSRWVHNNLKIHRNLFKNIDSNKNIVQLKSSNDIFFLNNEIVLNQDSNIDDYKSKMVAEKNCGKVVIENNTVSTEASSN